MKRIILIAAAGLLLVSCKKTYTCECTYNTTVYFKNQVDDQYTYSKVTDNGKAKTKVAEKHCKSLNGTVMLGNREDGEETTVSCVAAFSK